MAKKVVKKKKAVTKKKVVIKKAAKKKAPKKVAKVTSKPKKVAVEEVCCIGCKVDDFVQDLITSSDPDDRDIGYRFQDALDEHREEKQSDKYVPC